MTDLLSICLHCMRERNQEHNCPHCGTPATQTNWKYPLLKPGTVLHDKYMIGRSLGQGGFAITYIGLQIDLGRRVAIKEFMPADLAERREHTGEVTPRRDNTGAMDVSANFDRALKRFMEEGRHIVQCHHPAPHPNIVRVTDSFKANGTAYLVMDFVDGISLEEYLNSKPEGRVDEKTAVQVIMPVLDGLRVVHQRGFFHRDVKPANIYLSHDGPVILLDFGSARMQLREETNTMTIMLTPGYAPPEQYSSKGYQGSWTDVYGCAATLYRCITGAEPVSAMDRLAGAELIRPSEVPGCVVSPAVEETILKGLHPDRTQRPQTVEDFQKSLMKSGVAVGAPVIGKPQKQTGTRKTPQRRSRIPVALFSIFLLAGLSLLAGYLYIEYVGDKQLTDAKTTMESMLRTADRKTLEEFLPREYAEFERILDSAKRLERQDPRQAARRYQDAAEKLRTTMNSANRLQADETKKMLEQARAAADEARRQADIPEVRERAPSELAEAEKALTAAAMEKDASRTVQAYQQAENLFRQARQKALDARAEKSAERTEAQQAATEAFRNANTQVVREHARELLEQARETLTTAEAQSDPNAAIRYYREAEKQLTNALKTAQERRDVVERRPDDPPKRMVVNATELNIRRGPSLDYDILTKISQGATLDVLASPLAYDPWVRVKLASGDEGWVHSTYLVEPGAARPAEPERPRTEPTETRAQPVAAGPLRVNPQTLVFDERQLERTIDVYLGDGHAPKGDIKCSIEDRYGWMFTIDVMDNGRVRVRVKKDQMEFGSYALKITVGGQSERIPITIGDGTQVAQTQSPPREQVTPSPPPPPPPPARPQAPDGAGLLPQLPGRLGLDASYTEATVFTYTITKFPESVYVWYVNGKRVLRGKGENVLRFTLEPGDLVVRLALEHEGREYSSAEGRSRVNHVSPLQYRIKAGLEGSFENILPAGYNEYKWFLDGEQVSSNRNPKIAFPDTGSHKLEGLAWGAQNPSSTTPGYRRVIYSVEVY